MFCHKGYAINTGTPRTLPQERHSYEINVVLQASYLVWLQLLINQEGRRRKTVYN